MQEKRKKIVTIYPCSASRNFYIEKTLRENKIARIHAEEEGGISYSIQYLLNSWDDYNLYQNKFASNLQKEYQIKYANKSVAFRTVLEVIHIATP